MRQIASLAGDGFFRTRADRLFRFHPPDGF